MTRPRDREAPPVLVRDAAPAELPAVHAFVADAGLPGHGLDDAAVVLVADVGGAVVGTVALERHGTGPGAAFLLRSAAVDPAWRGRGVGSALTAAALERADADGAPVALLTETAERYFPRFGFGPVDRTGLPPALDASAELRGACPASAQALLRPAGRIVTTAPRAAPRASVADSRPASCTDAGLGVTWT